MKTPDDDGHADRLRAFLAARDACDYDDDEIDYIVGETAEDVARLLAPDIRAALARAEKAEAERDELRAADRDHAAARAGMERRLTDRADLIRRLEEEAEHEAFDAKKFTARHNHSRAAGHAHRAALMREAAKALKGGE
jgi:hypothetical protein